jgi:acyl-CoA synthetase (AMP-forming)/AMP-acid ligase II
MSKLDDLVAEVSVTCRLVSIAANRAPAVALVGGAWSDAWASGEDCGYASLAATVRAAAAGLAWRGLRAGDVVGIIVPDVVSFALATHAVRAVGGVPSPVRAQLSAVETAGQLAESGARMIITAQPLAGVALAAADRSWVRQVFSFGDAPGATRFDDLLGLDMLRPSRGRPDDVALLPFSRGPDGRLRPVPVTHAALVRKLDQADQWAGITGSDVVLAAPPVGDGLAYSLLVDSALLRGATVVSAQVEDLAAAAVAHRGTIAIVPRKAARDAPSSVRVLPVG